MIPRALTFALLLGTAAAAWPAGFAVDSVTDVPDAAPGDGCDTNCTVTACGDGVVTAGEQCDDANTAAGDCCSPTCQYEAASSACLDDGNQCTDDMCDGSGRCLHPPLSGTPCDDGNDCSGGDTCRDGVCRPGPYCGHDCISACDDGDPCTSGDFCFMSLCLPVSYCAACTTCDSDLGCVPVNDGDSCSDDDPCTENDTCVGGVCTAGSSCDPCTTCEPGVGCVMPPASCTSAAPRGASLALKHPATPGRDAVRFRWRSGAPVAKTDFGDPTSATPYRLCVYDGAGTLALGADAPASGSCGGHPCWRETEDAFLYRDAERTPEGLGRIELRGGDSARIKVQGSRPNLSLRSVAPATPVRARASRTDTNACWEAQFSTDIHTNGRTRFRAKSD